MASKAATFVERPDFGSGWVMFAWHRQRLNIHLQVTGLNDRRRRLQASNSPLLFDSQLALECGHPKFTDGYAPGCLFNAGLARHITLLRATRTKVKVSLTIAPCKPDHCIIFVMLNAAVVCFQYSGTHSGGAEVLRRLLVTG